MALTGFTFHQELLDMLLLLGTSAQLLSGSCQASMGAGSADSPGILPELYCLFHQLCSFFFFGRIVAVAHSAFRSFSVNKPHSVWRMTTHIGFLFYFTAWNVAVTQSLNPARGLLSLAEVDPLVGGQAEPPRNFSLSEGFAETKAG